MANYTAQLTGITPSQVNPLNSDWAYTIYKDGSALESGAVTANCADTSAVTNFVQAKITAYKNQDAAVAYAAAMAGPVNLTVS